jgi:hypothetical protein
MPHIFISYRRVDSQAMTSLIYRSLVQEYGEKNVFMDTKAITSGQWWAQVQSALARADVVIVIVGPKWETEIQNRLNNGDDYVREEVRIALELKKNIILAFVDGENGIDPLRLPDDIRELPKYQGYQILHEPFFDASIELLKQNIPKTKRKLFSPFTVALLTLLLVVIVGLVIVINNNLNTGNPIIASQNTLDSTEIITEISQVTDTPILPTPTVDGVYVADGYDLPIGTAEERAGDDILPSGWIDATGFATMIGGTAYNTGADLNLATGDDLGLPVYAIASGEVIFQDELPVWGNITIIRHDPLFTPDGIVAYSRYSATRNMIVSVGDRVSRGQQIGEIGNTNGRTAAYLNFDISTTTILEEEAGDYPRLDLDYLLENYVDPLEFIRNNRPIRNTACLTPYTGKTLLWYWKGDSIPEQSIAEFSTNLRQNAPNVAGVIIKVADGTTWQGVFDNSELAINGTDDVAEWVSVLETQGLELHIWAVPKGVDTSAEADLLASVVNVAGVKSLILDVEPYTGFWEGSESDVTAFMAILREKIANPDFHISISVDPRSQHYEAIFPEAWRPFIDSVHVQLFWTAFRQIPEDTIQVAWETWGDYGLPLIPILQSDAPLSEQQVAFNNLTDTPLNVAGMTWWRAGTISDYEVVNQVPIINCP